ncbi:MAG: glycosyltransferase [Patescibacteria group bacterium]
MTNHTRKKVIIFITKSNWGGAQKYVFDIATNLSQEHFDITVALGGKDLLYTKLVEAKINVIELETMQRDISLTKDIFSFVNIIKIIRKERPDIIHVNSTKISGLGAVAGRLLGVKNIIFTVHGWAFNEDRSSFSKLIIKGLYMIMLLLSHNVIAVSHKIVKDIKRWPVSKKKLTVIHNGILTPHFLSKTEARAEFSKISDHTFSDNVIVFGSVGELHPIKGHMHAIKAIDQILKERPTLQIRYAIIGAGEIENELKKEIIYRNILDRVFLLGYIKDAANYLKGFDYYLFPSLSEGLPYAIVEAGFAELPVIASDVGGISEVVEHNVDGRLVEPGKVQPLVDAIYTYIDNQDAAKKQAAALNAKTKDLFTIETMVEKTKAIYLK